jgi:molecular chaperone DnaJ
MSNRDYYDVLGVPRNASADQIKKSFRKKAAQLHPDNQDSGDEAAFKELVNAYEVLSDDQRRSLYDRYGEDGLRRAGGGSEPSFDFGAFGDLGEIFEYFFGSGTRTYSRQKAGPQRGSDLKMSLELDFLEAVFGCEKKIHIKHAVDCTECGGSGAARGSKRISCKTCNGQGQVRQSAATLFGQFTQILPCPACDGEGTAVEKPCGECQGHGQTRKSESIDLKVPPGVDHGARLRVSQAGDQGKRGAAAGDLYVVLHVRQHAEFVRDGNTVHLKQPVSFSMAALGGELLVSTVDGPRVLKIPSGIQSGTALTMKDQGVPHLANPTKRGDQVVHLIVETPSKLNDEEKSLLRQLAEVRGEKLTVAEALKNGPKEGQQSLFDVIAGVFKKNDGD